MIVADALVPIWYQDVCNHHHYVQRPVSPGRTVLYGTPAHFGCAPQHARRVRCWVCLVQSLYMTNLLPLWLFFSNQIILWCSAALVYVRTISVWFSIAFTPFFRENIHWCYSRSVRCEILVLWPYLSPVQYDFIMTFPEACFVTGRTLHKVCI